MFKKIVVTILVCLTIPFCLAACGSDAPKPTSYSPSDIQVEAIEDGTNLYSVIYDIDTSDTDAWREAWSGNDTDEVCVNTAVDGIKACMERDDWIDGSAVIGYAGEKLLRYKLYSYATEYDFTTIQLYQLGIANDTYKLQGELD